MSYNTRYNLRSRNKNIESNYKEEDNKPNNMFNQEWVYNSYDTDYQDTEVPEESNISLSIEGKAIKINNQEANNDNINNDYDENIINKNSLDELREHYSKSVSFDYDSINNFNHASEVSKNEKSDNTSSLYGNYDWPSSYEWSYEGDWISDDKWNATGFNDNNDNDNSNTNDNTNNSHERAYTENIYNLIENNNISIQDNTVTSQEENIEGHIIQPQIPLQDSYELDEVDFYNGTIGLSKSIEGKLFLSVHDVFKYITIGGKLSSLELIDLEKEIEDYIFERKYPENKKVSTYGKYHNVMRDMNPKIIKVIPYRWEHYRDIAKICISFAKNNAEYIAY